MKARRWIANLLLLGGVAAIDVWIWSHAGAVIYQGWLDREFDRERQGALVGESSTKGPEAIEAPGALSDNSPVGRLVIPRLHVRAMVREGVGEDTLSLALGHIPETALPGEKGNVGIAGHRDTLFRSLRNIRKNDLIVFETRNGTYEYRVEGMQIVKPAQVSVLKASGGHELTLVTCYPFYYIGSAPDRFIVKARQVVQKEDARRPGGSGRSSQA